MRSFMILSNQRSGSTFFAKYLDSHPDIYCGLELFIQEHFDKEYESDSFYHYCSLEPSRSNRYRSGNRLGRYYIAVFRNRMAKIGDPSRSRSIQLFDAVRPKPHLKDACEFLDEFFGRGTEGLGAKGFKLMYNQANMSGLDPRRLAGRGICFIHWVRSNTLNVFVSNERKNVSGIAHATNEVPQISIEIDTATLLRKLDIITNTARYYRQRLSGLDSIEVCYEDFVADQESEIGRVLDFLQVERRSDLSTSLRKITTGGLEDVISNYGEVSDVLKGTRYAKYL